MTLQQLSYQYQEQAQALHQRIDLLRQAQARCGDRESAEHLQRRIRVSGALAPTDTPAGGAHRSLL